MPLLYVRDGESLVVAGTNWGRPGHPGWSARLLADPEAVIEVEGMTVSVLARPAEGEERARHWQALNAMWPAYEEYQRRSGRTARVFVLEPDPDRDGQ